ncbi:TPA: 3-hydroxyacyl-CoA dehydrogenase family protein [Streptococcus suis]|uniref:3-hydroxyacyl-CoA dehydrogenase family protein n=1 Tax=Streptococcus suis TaxID=1307 RepID=UPI00211CB455|nr:3-hydroxyacyl-CoA dehydrogenase family protein [Streptococcus suis]UUM57949.1 3-hydroxyacyl-CoA dehydrogenase family protein [Streptococcus suis]UUM62181.1 3-hydroxyacyl-CoA dehydrogenase family protein [Streptococcus suis]
MSEIKRVAVIGSGLMGRQIALNSALYGYTVFLNDKNEEALEKAKEWTVDYLNGRIAKGKLTQEHIDDVNKVLFFEPDIKLAVEDVDLVIEAIIEDRQIKFDFFKEVTGLVKPGTILATNSSFMVSSLFKDAVREPELLANFHYFNPALVMKLVEVVKGEHTSMETVERLMDFARNTGKDPVFVMKENDGFLANSVLRAVSRKAMELYDEGIASYQDIDTAVEKGLNYPMGPFRLMDLTGVDLAYLAAKRQQDETGERRPGIELLEKMYNEKKWGRKTGEGFYKYTK